MRLPQRTRWDDAYRPTTRTRQKVWPRQAQQDPENRPHRRPLDDVRGGDVPRIQLLHGSVEQLALGSDRLCTKCTRTAVRRRYWAAWICRSLRLLCLDPLQDLDQELALVHVGLHQRVQSVLLSSPRSITPSGGTAPLQELSRLCDRVLHRSEAFRCLKRERSSEPLSCLPLQAC